MNYLDGKNGLNELTPFLNELKDFVPSIPDPIYLSARFNDYL